MSLHVCAVIIIDGQVGIIPEVNNESINKGQVCSRHDWSVADGLVDQNTIRLDYLGFEIDYEAFLTGNIPPVRFMDQFITLARFVDITPTGVRQVCVDIKRDDKSLHTRILPTWTDQVFGFFNIWSIPESSYSRLAGSVYAGATVAQMTELVEKKGFTIVWTSLYDIQEALDEGHTGETKREAYLRIKQSLTKTEDPAPAVPPKKKPRQRKKSTAQT